MRALKADWVGAKASVIAEEVVMTFSKLHPKVSLAYGQWRDLAEMIELEIIGDFIDDDSIGARNLLSESKPQVTP